MVSLSQLFVYALSLLVLVVAQTDPSRIRPFMPPALPIAVRSPYLNLWMPQMNNAYFMNLWTRHWDMRQMSLFVSVYVDGEIHQLLGGKATPIASANQNVSIEFTPTRTIITQYAGPMEVNMTFWNPIEPDDPVRQSYPGVYLEIGLKSIDGEEHDVSVYSDVTNEWASGNKSEVSNATTTILDDLVYHQWQIINPAALTEVADQAQDAITFYGLINRQRPLSLAYEIGTHLKVHNLFNRTGTLTNSTDTSFSTQPIKSKSGPYVSGLSISLGNITSTDANTTIVYHLAVLRDPVVLYTKASGENEMRSPAYLSQYVSKQTAYEAFIRDFPRARDAAISFDDSLLSASSAISSGYASLISLVSRQVLGAGEITMGRAIDGSWNQSDVMMFVKDMDGLSSKSENVNPVDAIFAAFPGYLYLNPKLGEYVLRPLLLYQSSNYSQPYAAMDLGGPYPNATGNNSPHNTGIEQSSNMLIMVLAQSQASGNGTLIREFYPLLKKFGNYLANTLSTLGASPQVSADAAFTKELPSANQTNLILKGALAIAAMAKISEKAGQTDDAGIYTAKSAKLLQEWLAHAISTDNTHLVANFGQQTSSALIYNLVVDRWLNLNAIPMSVYRLQNDFLTRDAGRLGPGVPLSSLGPQISRTDWTMFAAATATTSNSRDLLITLLRNQASQSSDSPLSPFAVVYDTTSGEAIGGINSAAQGAVFSLLAINQTKLELESSQLRISGRRRNTGAIVGGVLSGVIVIVALASCAFLFRRRQRRRDVTPEIFTPFKHSNRRTSTKSGANIVTAPVVAEYLVDSHTIFQKQTEANQDIRAEVDVLRRELETLREDRYSEGNSVRIGPLVDNEEPPSYFQQEACVPIAV